MRTRTVVAVGIGVLALGIGSAGPAVADSSWAAAAESPSSGDGNFAWGPNGQQRAESDALNHCTSKNHSDCVIVASSAQCVALATSPSDTVAYGGGSGATVEAATSSAVSNLKAKGYNDAHVLKGNTACSWDPSG